MAAAPASHEAVWDRVAPRAFNTAGHPSLSAATEPRQLTAAHALSAASPALVAIYPARDAQNPYPMSYVPPPAAKLGLPTGIYAAAEPGEEFVVRVGGRGGVDSICNQAASADVLVNVTVGGREVGDSCVLQRGMGDIVDEVFQGFLISEKRRAKLEAEEEDDDDVEEGRKEDKKGGVPQDVGLLEVRFATAVRIPPDPDAPLPSAAGGGDGVRVGKAVGDMGGVSERAAAKHGLSVGVAGGGEAVARRNWMGEGVCYGEDVPEMAITVRLRERWWLEAKGVLPQKSGKWVKEEAPDAGIMVQLESGAAATAGPPKKKAKLEVVDLTD